MTVITLATNWCDVSNNLSVLDNRAIDRDVIISRPLRSSIHAAVCRMLEEIGNAVIHERGNKRPTNHGAENSSPVYDCSQSKRTSLRAKSASCWGPTKNECDQGQCREYLEQNAEGDTRLHIAVVQQLPILVMSLVRTVPHPSYLDIKNDDAQTPLHVAVITRQADVVGWLLEAGADTSLRDTHGNTALHLACQTGDMNCVKALTKCYNKALLNSCQGSDVKALTKSCQIESCCFKALTKEITPRTMSCHGRGTEPFQIEGAKDVTKPKESQDTKVVCKHCSRFNVNVPIKYCWEEDNMSCVKTLTKHSVGYNAKVFTHSRRGEMTAYSQKPDINVPTDLSIARGVGCTKSVVNTCQKRDVRFDEGCELVGKNDTGLFPDKLCESVIGELLPKNEVQPRSSFSPRELAVLNYDGETCSHVAANHGHVDVLRWLVRCGADPNAREAKSGNTVLHVAVERSIDNVSRYLLEECDVDIEARNYAGVTAYDVACDVSPVLAGAMARVGGYGAGSREMKMLRHSQRNAARRAKS